MFSNLPTGADQNHQLNNYLWMKVGLWITMRSGFQRAQDDRVCESDIRLGGPDRVPEDVVHGPRQVAFSDVSREEDRRP